MTLVIVSGVVRVVMMIFVTAGFRVTFAEMLSMLNPRALKVPAMRARTSGRLLTITAIARSFNCGVIMLPLPFI